MNQFILTEEQKLQKSLYEQRFQVTKERLEMYIKLKNAAQAQVQLNTLDNLASQAGDEKLSNNLLYTQAGYYTAKPAYRGSCPGCGKEGWYG